jgi:Putative MetA-pathway of phenol degradation
LPARRQPLALSLAFVVVASAPSRAERPLETEDAVPLEPGQVQAEVSANYGHGPGGTNVGAFLGVLTVGLLPSLDLAAQGAVLALDEPRRTTHSGVGDTIVQSKWLIAEERSIGPALLVSPLVRVPTGGDQLGLPGVDVQVIGVASKTLGAWTLTGNLDYAWATDDRRRDLWTLATSAVWEWTQVWTLAGEVIGDLGTSRDRDRAVVRAGVIWNVREGVALDAAIAGGTHGPLPDLQVTIGATIDLH